jgi:hypothetical protein
MNAPQARRLKQHENENAKLTRLLVEAMLDASALRELLSRTFAESGGAREDALLIQDHS